MQLQELIGGQWGEISVMLGYMFQAWNSRGPIKYRDMTLDIGTEEIGHVEMLATMVARLLENSPVEAQEEAAKDSIVGAVLGGANVADVIMAGMSPQHAIVSGSGAMPVDSQGNRWTADYIVASGNLLADFRFNVAAESQGRLQAARLYNMTDDRGVKDMLSYLLARDTMHQNQWIAAIAEVEADGLDSTPCPQNFPIHQEHRDFSYKFLNHSRGTQSAQGRWAAGPSPDGKGEFEYVAEPPALGPVPELGMTDPRLYGTQGPDAACRRLSSRDSGRTGTSCRSGPSVWKGKSMERQKDGPVAAMLHRAQDAMAGMVGQAEAAAAGRSIESFIENAWASNLYEVRAAELALHRSRSPAVRALAEMMIRDHSASQQQLQVELDRMIGQFLVPTALDGRRESMLDHLAQAPDDGFDSAYLSQQAMAHQEAIAMFGAYAEHGEQPLLASYARATLPILRQHAEHVAAAAAHR